ncbi:MAG: type II toxin-antitoxin system HicB family antitoxin [Myxococcota bacterium]|nr:type II toxin-antitoxin system HicB family antitoxin [Myxococcota bacterium]
MERGRSSGGRSRNRPVAVMKVASFTVHFVPAEEGGYVVEVPALEGCVTEGDSLDEAERNAREAIALYVESLGARGLPVPADRRTVVRTITIPLASPRQ